MRPSNIVERSSALPRLERSPALPGISLVINTLNEESNIEACIRSAAALVDEVVVCDMRSTDRTVSLAENAGARVVPVDVPFTGFGPRRYFAVSHASREWVLVLDADERLTPPLAEQLRRVAAAGAADVVRVGILFWYFGGWVYHGDFFSDRYYRFFRRDVYLELYAHADEGAHNDLSPLARADHYVTLPKQYYIEHYAYPTIEKYVVKTLGMYARVEGQDYHRRGRPFTWIRLLGEPTKEFVRRFLKERGYRDGMRGFILAVLFSAYRFVTWANVWFAEQQTARATSPPE